MPYATTDDDVKFYFEETGRGAPIVFVHEFAGDHRSWEPQLRHFGQRYRAITFGARGYPPSDVPEDIARYSQNRATDDIACVLNHLEIAKAHVVGLSMGGFAALHFGFRHAGRALSLIVAGCGYGAEKGQEYQFRKEVATAVDALRGEGMAAFAEKYAMAPRACNSLTRIRAASLNSSGNWPNIPPSARPIRSSGCKANGLRSTTWWTR